MKKYFKAYQKDNLEITLKVAGYFYDGFISVIDEEDKCILFHTKYSFNDKHEKVELEDGVDFIELVIPFHAIQMIWRKHLTINKFDNAEETIQRLISDTEMVIHIKDNFNMDEDEEDDDEQMSPVK